MGKKIGKGGKKVASKAAVVAPASAGVVAPPAAGASLLFLDPLLPVTHSVCPFVQLLLAWVAPPSPSTWALSAVPARAARPTRSSSCACVKGGGGGCSV